MGWFNKNKDDVVDVESKRHYRFEDFIDSTPEELPEDAPAMDRLSREVQQLREQFNDFKVDGRGIDDWFGSHLESLALDAAKQFDSARLAAEKADIEQYTQQVAEAIFQREAQGLFQACVRAVLRQLGKGL